jgi:hypothetical protein
MRYLYERRSHLWRLAIHSLLLAQATTPTAGRTAAGSRRRSSRRRPSAGAWAARGGRRVVHGLTLPHIQSHRLIFARASLCQAVDCSLLDEEWFVPPWVVTSFSCPPVWLVQSIASDMPGRVHMTPPPSARFVPHASKKAFKAQKAQLRALPLWLARRAEKRIVVCRSGQRAMLSSVESAWQVS